MTILLIPFEYVLLVLVSWIGMKDRWWEGWLNFYVAGSFLLAARIKKAFGWPAAICFFLTLLRAIGVFAEKTTYADLGPATAMAMDNVALGSAFAFLLITFIFATCDWVSLERFEEGFAALCMADSVYVLFQTYLGDLPIGFMGNASINGCLIAMTYPLLNLKDEVRLKRPGFIRSTWDILCVFIPIFALFASRSSVPVVTLALILFLYIWLQGADIEKLNTKAKRLSVAVSMVGAITLIAIWLIPDLFVDSGRMNIWKVTMEWWIQKPQRWIEGTGLGTFFMWGPAVQKEAGVGTDQWWIWAHNDWYQVLFEMGFVLLVSYIWLFIDTARKLFRKAPYLGISLVALGFVALFNFPMHVAPTALFAGFLVSKANMK